MAIHKENKGNLDFDEVYLSQKKKDEGNIKNVLVEKHDAKILNKQ